MAPMMYDDKVFYKRSSTDAGFDIPKSQRPRLSTRHHKLQWKSTQHDLQSPVCQDDEVIVSSLERSISLALQAVGFEQASPVALGSFRDHVEAYMAHFLDSVRQSMLSCRRTQSTPQDYIHALRSHQLTLRSLLVHLDPPVSPSQSQISFDLEPTHVLYRAIDLPFLTVPSTGIADSRSFPHIPPNFPPLPSVHTYQITENFVKREQDPKRIRERATEEGRLGEEALRRLMSAGAETHDENNSPARHPLMTLRRRRDMLWKSTMEAVAAVDGKHQEGSNVHDPGGMEIDGKWNGSKVHFGSAVNAESAYWRKNVTRPGLESDEEAEAGRKNS